MMDVDGKRAAESSVIAEPPAKKQCIDYMGIPVQLRKYQWLYDPTNILNQADREKVIKFMNGQCKRTDVTHEDIPLSQEKDGRTAVRLKFQPKLEWTTVRFRTLHKKRKP